MSVLILQSELLLHYKLCNLYCYNATVKLNNSLSLYDALM